MPKKCTAAVNAVGPHRNGLANAECHHEPMEESGPASVPGAAVALTPVSPLSPSMTRCAPKPTGIGEFDRVLGGYYSRGCDPSCRRTRGWKVHSSFWMSPRPAPRRRRFCTSMAKSLPAGPGPCRTAALHRSFSLQMKHRFTALAKLMQLTPSLVINDSVQILQSGPARWQCGKCRASSCRCDSVDPRCKGTVNPNSPLGRSVTKDGGIAGPRLRILGGCRLPI